MYCSLSAPPSSTSGTTSTDPILSRMEKKFNENAPDKLASDFKKIYDLEWKSAYHELEKHYKMKDQQITEVLGAIARVCRRIKNKIVKYCETIYKRNS